MAQVRQLGIGSGNKFMASLITYAVENLIEKGEVSEIELEEILTDYLVRPSFKKQCKMGNFRYDLDPRRIDKAKADLDALWHLVPKIPEKRSYLLLTHLPSRPDYFNPDIPPDVLDRLTSNQMSE